MKTVRKIWIMAMLNKKKKTEQGRTGRDYVNRKITVEML